MNKQTKYKNIIINESSSTSSNKEPLINENLIIQQKSNKNKEKNKKLEKTLCVCGKFGSSGCIFKVCKSCCNSDYCQYHHESKKQITPKMCVFCNKKTKYHRNNMYFCQGCYEINYKNIDNITHISPMFEINNNTKCICESSAPNTCLFQLCRDCCPSKNCPRHNKESKLIGLNNCAICSKIYNCTQLNSFYNKSINQIINYCKKCYIDNRKLLNNLIFNNAIKEQIAKFKIKVLETKEEIEFKNKKKEIEEKEKKENEKLKLELLKYKDQIINNNKFKQFKKLPNFCFSEFLELNFKFECPICKNVDDMEKMIICEDCNKFICTKNCVEEKLEKCQNKNCNYCNRGTCNAGKLKIFCKDCFVDDNKEFFNKYKNTIVTNEIIQEENIDLVDLSEKDYTLKYQCNICEDIIDLNIDNLACCDRCDNYVCVECGFHKYITCGIPFCTHCSTQNCWNAEHYFFCDECAVEMGAYEEFSDSDNSDKEEINVKPRCISPVELATNKSEECNICYLNKKNYACVPCGHLCMCGDCANKVDKKCPMCNVEFTNIIKIFA